MRLARLNNYREYFYIMRVKLIVSSSLKRREPAGARLRHVRRAQPENGWKVDRREGKTFFSFC